MAAFITFMLLERGAGSYLIVGTLMLGACGIFDLFWWGILGEMLEYADNPAQIFGIGLSFNVLGVLFGDILRCGDHLDPSSRRRGGGDRPYCSLHHPGPAAAAQQAAGTAAQEPHLSGSLRTDGSGAESRYFLENQKPGRADPKGARGASADPVGQIKPRNR